ncbi:tyrosine-type recombinase/integrase [Intrasporangium sp. DVR]|uniref:tyrosine-type recombinase/integrase n=1 Tax=Intrasporangium sp. DVR TaxID=3127867 RepID=UPI00313A666F
MADVDVNRADVLEAWAEPLEAWLTDSAISEGRSRRTVLAFSRFSAWVTGRGLGAEDVNEDVIDEYVDLERQRSGSRVPAAAQYLPLVKRFLAAHGVLVLRPPLSRRRDGRPRLREGPLDEAVLDLVGWLQGQGYAAGTVVSVACTAARLSSWMAAQGSGVQDLDAALLARFVASQARSRRRRHPSSARRIVTVRKFLLATGLLAPPSLPPPEAPTPAEQLLQEWTAHLCTQRGVSRGWANETRRWVAGFLAELAVDSDRNLIWDGVDAAAVNRYVARQGQGYSLASRRHLVSAMRGLLDWAFLTGRVNCSMSAGILRPAPAAPALPHGPTTVQVQALIAAADTSTPAGLRDRAIVILISRLALRAGEVAALGLDDLHWHDGRLVIHGKGERVLTLPLPSDVGQALVDYLRDGRPAGAADRAVFTRLRPPLVGLSSKGVSGVVAHLAAGAGLGTVHAHALRHTAATAVLAAGGSLIEARELLGHARTDTTMVYARTDLVALRELVTSWGKVPGP